MKNIIDITRQNRYGFHIWFEQCEEDDNLYTIHSEKDWVIEYATCAYEPLPEDSEYYDFYNEKNGIKGINLTFDPDGGPYMEIGKYTIDGKILTRVFTRDGITYFQVNN